MDVYPNGNYRLKIAVFDDIDDKIADLTVFHEIHIARRDRVF